MTVYLDELEIKLTILYTLKRFKLAMSEEDLQDVLVWTDIVDYFTMLDSLYFMQDINMVCAVTIDGIVKYDITKKGLDALEYLYKKIPYMIRSHINDKIYKMMCKLRRGKEIIADIEPIDENQFMAKCGVYDFRFPLMELKIFAGSREHASAIANKFKESNEEIYKLILEKLQ